MNSRETLREQILTKAVVHGKVILSSGKEADYYVEHASRISLGNRYLLYRYLLLLVEGA